MSFVCPARARGARTKTVAIFVSPAAKAARSRPELVKAVRAAEKRAGDEGELEEMVICLPPSAFSRPGITRYVKDTLEQRKDNCAGVPPGDPEGTHPYVSIYDYTQTFAFVVPRHVSVPPHRVMAPEEVDALCASLAHGTTTADFPAAAASDPAVVWAGGREGQVVEVLRDSHTAVNAVFYRRVTSSASPQIKAAKDSSAGTADE